MGKPPGESQGAFLMPDTTDASCDQEGSMLDLSTPKAPFDIALPYGLS